MVSGLRYGIVLGRAFAPWRLCVKSFLPDGRSQGPGQKANSHARPGWGRMRTEFNAKAQSDFFLLRNQETKNHRKDFMVSWLPYGIVLGRAFAPLRLCVKSFCMMADCKVWPSAWWLTARSGRPQGPGQKANGKRMAGPGPDWPRRAGARRSILLCHPIQGFGGGVVFLVSSVLVVVPSDDLVTVESFVLTVPSLLTVLDFSLETWRSHPTSINDNAKADMAAQVTIL